MASPSPTVPRAHESRGPRFALDGQTTSADGTRIHHYTLGDGAPALVLCDGLGCDGYIWKYLAADLAADFRVVRWHYRGHGSSAPPADRSRMRIADLCDDLVAVLDALGIPQAVLVGHSLGVQVILEFHRRHPGRVIALVPICGSYGRPVDTFRDSGLLRLTFPLIHGAFHRFPQAAQRVWGILDSELAYQVGMQTEVNGDLMRREDFRPYLRHLANMDVRLFTDLLKDAAEHDGLAHLAEIDVPTLIVAGERDAFTPYWLSTVMHARILGSELCTVPTGTHTAPIEMPELVNLRVRRFLEERVLSLPGKALEQQAG
jgi:pimeloyl-ACP methyl ester carboxylesterase